VKEKNGRKKIQFTDSGGQRQSIRLGIATMKQAEGVKTKVETILGDLICGRPHDDDISRWLGSLNVILRKRMEKVGLVEGVGNRDFKLGELLNEYFASLMVKPGTVATYEQARQSLIGYFGKDRLLRTIGTLDAEKWRQQAKASGLAEPTIAKRVKVARQAFKKGMKWKMVSENPFAEVRVGSMKNKSRQYFITPEEAKAVLAACPNAEWRLIFALGRYGGLRCPSEHLALKWADVDWENGRLRVPSSKTEHTVGGDCRIIPLFPEIRSYLLDAFEQAEPGTQYVITSHRQPNTNLRTQLQRIIQRAGLKAWPRLFHNLRSTRQTELAQTFPIHVVCQWLGNSEAVAQDHYLQVTEAHFAKAIESNTNSGEQAVDTADTEGKKAAQIAAQQTAEIERNPSQSLLNKSENPPENPGDLAFCGISEDATMTPMGFEPMSPP